LILLISLLTWWCVLGELKMKEDANPKLWCASPLYLPVDVLESEPSPIQREPAGECNPCNFLALEASPHVP
jgi:hypothetical protein